MLLSIALVLLLGFIMGRVFKLIHFPPLVGMILCGIIIGPQLLNIIDQQFLEITPYLRHIALVIILLRAGLSIDLKDLKQLGRPMILMCFIPAIVEILVVTLIAPMIVEISYIEAMIMGCILAPVSAAVVIPSMIKIKKAGYGSNKKISELILGGTSADDIVALVLYGVLIQFVLGQNMNVTSLVDVPIAIVFGVFVGIFFGVGSCYIFKRVKLSPVIKTMILVSLSLGILYIENEIPSFPISSLLAIMIIGVIHLKKLPKEAYTIESTLSNFWEVMSIFLFVSVGSVIDFSFFPIYWKVSLLIISLGTIFRFLSVWLCLIKTQLDFKEKLFCAITYIPKATVQATFAAVPLGLGLGFGPLVLTVSVMAVLVLAPIGSLLIELTYKKLLKQDGIRVEQ